MKNSNTNLLILAFVSTLLIVSCTSNIEKKAENLKEAQKDVAVAEEELSEARLDSVNQYANYRRETAIRLAKNEKQIEEIRAKAKIQKTAIRAKMDKDLDVLKQKNEDFKIEMKNQKDSIYADWESFKRSYNTRMDELGKSISKRAQDNMDNN